MTTPTRRRRALLGAAAAVWALLGIATAASRLDRPLVALAAQAGAGLVVLAEIALLARRRDVRRNS